jgi:hypothetical protein
MAYLLFHNFGFPQRHLVAQVAFWAMMAFQADIPLVEVEARLFLSPSSVSVDFMLYHLRMEGSRPDDFWKPLPAVFPSQPSPSDAHETQLLTSFFV